MCEHVFLFMNIPEILEELKLKYNIHADRDLAFILGVTRRTITRWRTGKSSPTSSHKIRINKTLKASSEIEIALNRLASGSIDESCSELLSLAKSDDYNSKLLALFSTASKLANQLKSAIAPRVIQIATIYDRVDMCVSVNAYLDQVNALVTLIKPGAIDESRNNTGVIMTMYYSKTGELVYCCDLSDKNMLSMVNKARKYKASNLI